jgi:hypothetical protein
MWSYTGCCAGHVPASPAWCWPQTMAQYAHWCSFVPKDISADKNTATAQAPIGGAENVFLSLDYVKEAAAESPSVKVTITDPSGTGEWNITTIPDGFQMKVDFASAAPGASVQLAVNGCTAQLKWFERIY